MVIGGWCPAGSGMAGTTITAKTSLVDIFSPVAGGTVLRCRLKVCKSAGINVALRAQDLGMHPGQLERSAVVVKVFAIGVRPIMACQAVNPEIQDMVLHEGRVHLEVTGGADVLVESGVNLRMAIVTTEGGTVGFELVGS